MALDGCGTRCGNIAKLLHVFNNSRNNAPTVEYIIRDTEL